MVYEADIRHPCKFEINRNLIGLMVEEYECDNMESDDDEETANHWEHRVERICIKVEALIWWALNHYNTITIPEAFLEAYEPYALRA